VWGGGGGVGGGGGGGGGGLESVCGRGRGRCVVGAALAARGQVVQRVELEIEDLVRGVRA
jgi:hypothetical protein